MTTSTSPSSYPYHHVSPSSDLARAREIFLANGFGQFDTPQSSLQSECPGDLMSRVTCTVWGEYMQTVCRAMVRTHTHARAMDAPKILHARDREWLSSVSSV